MIGFLLLLLKLTVAEIREREGAPSLFTDCFRGSDQGDLGRVKWLVTPDFPSLYKNTISCKWTINTNYGQYIKLVPEIMDIPCRGNNMLKIIDIPVGQTKKNESPQYCGSVDIPAFVSSDVSFEIHFIVDSPAAGARLKLGYQAVTDQKGIKVNSKSISKPIFKTTPRQSRPSPFWNKKIPRRPPIQVEKTQNSSSQMPDFLETDALKGIILSYTGFLILVTAPAIYLLYKFKNDKCEENQSIAD